MATQLTTIDETTGGVPALTIEGERFALRQRQARMFSMSPLVPDHLRKGTTEQAIANCWIALTLAEAMGEVPLIVMQNIHVVNGKAGFATQYMIARANSSGIFKGRIDWRIDRSDPENLAITAYAIIKDSGQQVEVTCDMKMASAEGWTKNPKYQTMPEVMLRYRSAAFLVRFYAPDVMLGYQTVDEIIDVVAAASPSTELLTGQMLIEQSQPAVLAAVPYDPETGEIIDAPAATSSAPEPRLPEGMEPEPQQASHAENAAKGPWVDHFGEDRADAPHPAQARADEIIADYRAIISIMDLNSVASRAKDDVAAMPIEIAATVTAEFEASKARIAAAHETAKKAERAGAQ